MATHSSTLAWRIPWTEERSLAGYSPWGCRVGYDWATDTHTKLKRYLMVHFIHSSSSCRKQDGAGSAWDAEWLANPHPFWKSWGLSACNSWPWANKRLSCLLKKKKKTFTPVNSSQNIASISIWWRKGLKKKQNVCVWVWVYMFKGVCIYVCFSEVFWTSKWSSALGHCV